MGTVTSTSTLAPSASRTFNLAPASAVSLTLLPNCRVTVTETPAVVPASPVGGNASRVHNLRYAGVVTYGPYAMGGTIVVSNDSNSGSTLTWTRTDALIAEDVNGISSVLSGDGIPLTGPISAACRAFFPLTAPTGLGYPRDLSGNSVTAYPMGTYADTSWAANAGYLTVGAGANLGMVIPASELDLSAADGRNQLFAIGVKKAAPASEEPVLGWSTGAGTGAGINLAATTAGKVRVYGTTTQLATFNITASQLTAFDNTDHTIEGYIRNDINQFELYIDGWLSNVVSFRNSAGHRDVGQSGSLALGGIGGSDQTTYAAQFRGLHVYTVPDRFTAVQLLVNKLHANILQPLTAGDL